MGKMILAMNVSVDGYVDDLEGTLAMGPPSAAHFRYWIETIRGHAGAIYGRRMYELMHYWDEDRPEWDAPQREFAAVWRRMPKWVVSSTLTSVGPNATLVRDDAEALFRQVAEETDGIVSVSGPELAGLAARMGLIAEYHLHLRPVVLGSGKPFFPASTPPLRLVSSTKIDEDTLHLVYAPRTE
ncbi:dihydrofolate reductase family protein [Rhizobium sp. RU36D]|uniref:dihydrofolate reductase family protein n=1 Tax=Rhizobium sp. RU36D TaxID=1907415 RepID=UPI0009D8F8C8|nr:dihydrofolate reductase family protein [Rhizobium sp. RU36D]SMC96986.1 Dihydrofolate reductase [Rhizobium sp. RU36D]